jgi:hypothetical protein
MRIIRWAACGRKNVDAHARREEQAASSAGKRRGSRLRQAESICVSPAKLGAVSISGSDAVGSKNLASPSLKQQ